jgi:hypothetical protein
MTRMKNHFHIAAALIASTALLGPANAAEPHLDATVWTELARTHELSARFTQIQHRAILKNPLTSTGTVHFTRPQTLDWLVETPTRSSFTLKNSIATMSYPELGMTDTIDLASVPDASRLATSLLVWMQADGAAVERDFRVTYGDGSAHLAPRDPQLQKLLSAIDIRVAANPYRVTGVTLLEPTGDSVNITFSDVVLK